MDKPQVTIRDIIQTLDVSPSTVSRVFKDNSDIGQETRNLIHTHARGYSYKLNVPAVSLRSSRSNMIGVIVPQLVHHFFPYALSGIEMAATEAGYNITVTQSNGSYEQEMKIAQSFLVACICGVIASFAKNTGRYNHYQELLGNNIPAVFYGRICTGLETERVVVDDHAGSFVAVKRMIQTGCKRIFFHGADPHLEITKNRRNGYLNAMKKYKTPVNDSMIKLCDNREHATAITPDLLESDNCPDDFFAINDETTAGTLYACKLVGLKVLDEVSICGFISGVTAQGTDPRLTTVEQHGEGVGKNAFNILTDKLKGNEEKGTNRIVQTNLVVRGTAK